MSTDQAVYISKNKKSILGSFYDGVTRFHIIEGPRKLLNLLWWRYVPGVKVKLRWPVGMIVVEYGHPKWYDVGAHFVELASADPNDHYRPWLEKHVGRQGWHWDWRMEDNDAAYKSLTLKVCKSKTKYATLAGIQWS